MKKIDCHTHIVNSSIRDEYFSRTDGYAIIMEFLPKFATSEMPDCSFETANSDKRLFLCPSIDISEEIEPQLSKIESFLDLYPIVGLKIFLTYQAGRADDKKLIPIYEFAEKYHLTVTYHTGSCSLVLPTDNDLEGSNAIYVQNVAKQFPTVNFVVAHMDDPRYDECIRIVHDQPNMFTDFSGAYEPGTPEGANINWAIKTFAKAINQFPDTYKSILYGTDFCPPINLCVIEDYDTTISAIFPKKYHEDIYYNNALRAFPRISEKVGDHYDQEK